MKREIEEKENERGRRENKRKEEADSKIRYKK